MQTLTSPPSTSALGNDPAASIAIYVHFPWCASLCPYCDFDKQATDFRLVDRYLDAILLHIQATPRRRAHSIFFGGGTPSLMTPNRLGKVIDALRNRFDLSDRAEISLEANPSDVVEHKIAAYLAAGVTRVSLGIQSLNDDELRFLGRRHSAEKARRAVAATRSAGCHDIGVDLIYGLPGGTTYSVQHSLDGLLALNPDHISCYALTLEATTPMGADAEAGRLILPDGDAVAEQYATIQGVLGSAGFEQYEISNWALPGHQSEHNLTYWRNGEYLGLGSGASGSFMGNRYKRTPVVRSYISAAEAGEPGMVEIEPWIRPTMMRDTVMLGLRLAEGISDAEFLRRFGVSLSQYCGARLQSLVQNNLLRWSNGRLNISPSHYLVSNAILAEILPDRTENPVVCPNQEVA